MNILHLIRDEFKKFSKRTLLLVCILTIITAGLLYMALIEQNPASKTTFNKPVQKVSIAHTILSLVPQGAPSFQYSKKVDLVASPHGNKVNGIQVELAYNPTAITNISVTPGTFFDHPVVLFHTIDKTNGRISYVIAPGLSDGLATQSGVVATITLTINPQATASTTLHFLPKTKVTQEGTLESVLRSTQDLTLTFPQPTHAPLNILSNASGSASLSGK